LKIAAFITTFLNDEMEDLKDCGGAERSAEKILTGLGKRGHEINLFTTSMIPNPSYSCRDCIAVYPSAVNFRIKSSRFSLGLFRTPFDRDVDVVQVHFTVPSAFIAGYYHSIIHKIPMIIIHHSDLNPDQIPNIFYKICARLSNFVYKKTLAHANYIVCPSKHFAENSPYLHNFLDKVVIVPHGIDEKEFLDIPTKEICRGILGINPDANVILFVGALDPGKGPQVLLKALPKIFDRYPNSEVFFIGVGSLKLILLQTALKYGLSSKVHFTGYLPRDRLNLYYRASDLLTLPSFSESFGNVILEAMICGVPVIASDVGGISDIITDGENGILFRTGDETMLADKICELLNNDYLKKRIILNGLEHVKEYTWEKSVKKIEELHFSCTR